MDHPKERKEFGQQDLPGSKAYVGNRATHSISECLWTHVHQISAEVVHQKAAAGPREERRLNDGSSEDPAAVGRSYLADQQQAQATTA